MRSFNLDVFVELKQFQKLISAYNFSSRQILCLFLVIFPEFFDERVGQDIIHSNVKYFYGKIESRYFFDPDRNSKYVDIDQNIEISNLQVNLNYSILQDTVTQIIIKITWKCYNIKFYRMIEYIPPSNDLEELLWLLTVWDLLNKILYHQSIELSEKYFHLNFFSCHHRFNYIKCNLYSRNLLTIHNRNNCYISSMLFVYLHMIKA